MLYITKVRNKTKQKKVKSSSHAHLHTDTRNQVREAQINGLIDSRVNLQHKQHLNGYYGIFRPVDRLLKWFCKLNSVFCLTKKLYQMKLFTHLSQISQLNTLWE